MSVRLLKRSDNDENFASNVITLKLDGSELKVLPREISFDTVSDEPIHIDFLRIVSGSNINLEIPVKFINNDKSPGLKRGGVLNIVRRKVELKCPTESIPKEIIVDLNELDIGASIKISSVNLPEKVITPFPDIPVWNGSPVDSPLLVWAEQGYGDNLDGPRLLWIPMYTARRKWNGRLNYR